MNSIFSDFKYAIRQWRRAPVFAVISIAMLAIGIGTNTAVFSVLNAAVLNVLPFPNPDQLVSLELKTDRGDSNTLSYLDFIRLREQSKNIRLSAWISDQANLQTNAEPLRVSAPRVTADFFGALQVYPLTGRFFAPDDEKLGAPGTVVLSESLWRQRFGGDPALIGRTLEINGEQHTVIGVAPRKIHLPQQCNNCMWLPLQPLHTPEFTDRLIASVQIVGRLGPGISPGRAAAELLPIMQHIHQEAGESDRALAVHVVSLALVISRDYRAELYLVFGAVFFVLLIACVNVANLLLARNTTRQHEIGLRMALGAPRIRIVSQAFNESFLLALFGSVFGLLIAWFVLRIVQTLGAGYIENVSSVHIDLGFLVLTVFAAIVTSLIAGLGPALLTARTQALRPGSAARIGSNGRQQFLRGMLVAAEVALMLVLLVSTGLLLRTLYSLEHKDMGMTINRVMTARLTPSSVQDENRDIVTAWHVPLLQRLRQIPQVTATGVGTFLPLERSGVSATIMVADEQIERPPVTVRLISPGYLSALGVPMLRGRDFSDSDRPQTPLVAIIDEKLAKRDFPGQDPIGKRVTLIAGARISYIVVGIEHSYQQHGPQNDLEPEIALDILQINHQSALYDIAALQIAAVIRSPMPTDALRPLLQDAVKSIDSAQAISQLETLEEILVDSLAAQRFALAIIGGFAVLAVLLAVAGIYSMLSWTVVQRTREIGVRLALGATRKDIVGLVLARSLRWTGAGALAGIACMIASGRALSHLLWGVTAFDPLTISSGLILLFVIATLASLLPALRASRLYPVVALRTE